MSHIFLSYSRQDFEIARKLAESLTEKGWEVWWDRTILPGQSFGVLIEEKLNTAKCVIVLWSSHSINSNWVIDEAGVANSLGTLLPVKIEDGIKIPLGFGRIHSANLSDWFGDFLHPEFKTVLAAIEYRIPKVNTLPSVNHIADNKEVETHFIHTQPLMETIETTKTTSSKETKEIERGENNIPENSAPKEITFKADLKSANRKNLSFVVVLENETHLVEHVVTFWGVRIKVDSNIVSSGMGLDQNYDFQLSDGRKMYNAKFQARNKLIGYTFDRFRLIVDGKVLSSEGDWSDEPYFTA